MGHNLICDMLLDIDLNKEPCESGMGLESLCNEVDDRHDSVERFRKLAAVIARDKRREGCRRARNSVETSLVARPVNGRGMAGVAEGTLEVEKGRKRARTDLVAKALEMDSKAIKVVKNGGNNFFDCNICLGTASEPVLTCCGHLYCWSCFYFLPYVDSTSKECPACKGEVKDNSVVPVFCNGNRTSEADWDVPPRPKAARIESSRQQLLTPSASTVSVAEAFGRIREGTGTPGNRQMQPITLLEALSRTRPRTRLFSRMLQESATPPNSVPSALSSTAGILEGHGTDINVGQRNEIIQSIANGEVPADLQLGYQTSVSTAEMNSGIPNEVADPVRILQNSAQSLATESISVSVRIYGRNRVSDESRRRRLN